MAMSVENQGLNDLGFFWDSQPWNLPNSDDLLGCERDRKEELHIEMPPPPPPPTPTNHLTQEEIEKKEEELAAVTANNKKRSRADRNGKRPMKNDGDDHDLHIWTERERRKKMRNMFASLHALLPQLPSKADKSSIVDEAVSYIKTLQKTVEDLEKKKQQRNQSVSISPIACESAVTNPHWNPYDSSSSSRDNNNNNNALTITSNRQGSLNPSSAAAVNNSPFFSPVRQPAAFKTFASQNVVVNICGDEAQFSICAEKKPSLFTTIAFVLEKHKIDVISASILCNDNSNRYMVLAHASKALLQFAEANTVEETFKRAAGEIMMWLA